MMAREEATILNEPRVRAPQLPNNPELWLNLGGKALQLQKGVVYLLDFWTYCCINCLHILPDLKYLETKYADRPFQIISIHSGKFDNEKDAENIRNAILRHDIRHPVLRDDEYRIWQAYDVSAWPTLGLVDAEGYYIGSVSGEGHTAELDAAIDHLLLAYDKAGLTAPRLATPVLEPAPLEDRPLFYPGKIHADVYGERLFIADTRHNRIVTCNMDGSNPVTIGSGQAGDADGSFAQATFHQPQGMALVGEVLFVCDCENHLLRRVDLNKGTVQTVAGTGEQGHAHTPGGMGLKTSLSSPWDICYDEMHDGQLYIAMAGTHQLWRYDIRNSEISVFAGTGREARLDGAAAKAAFAQPSGIATDGKAIYVADSESSSIRQISLTDDTQVTTLAGGNLFDWGDIDGKGEVARLQHPLGVAVYGDHLYIADTFNHKIKRLHRKTGEVVTLAGTGQAGMENGIADMARFYEPGGLSVTGDKLYIADTNNHRIRILDLNTHMVSTLEIPGLCGTDLCFPESVPAPAKSR